MLLFGKTFISNSHTKMYQKFLEFLLIENNDYTHQPCVQLYFVIWKL